MIRSLHAALCDVSPWVAIALILIFVLCSQAFEARKGAFGEGNRPLDGRWSYTPADAAKLLTDLGEKKRQMYAITQLTLDVLFPATYGLLFALLIAHLFPAPSGGVIALIPLAAALFDLFENISIAYMALTFTEEVPRLASAAQFFTRAKMILFGTSIGAVVVGVTRAVLRGT